MVPMMVTALFQLVHLNFTSFEMTMNLNESPKVKHVLVIVHHFTRCTRAYMTKDQKASTAVKSSFPFLEHLKGYSWTIIMLTVWDKLVDHYCISSPGKWPGGMSPPDPWKDDREVGG